MKKNTISKELKIAIKASKKAEKVIMSYYGRQIESKQKHDLTPVTNADIEAEKTIIETISNNFPKHGFLSEESGEINLSEDYIWIIDPIDGTKNFIRGNPLFSTQIALIKKGNPVLGVSNMPLMNEMMYAETGCGSYLNNKQINVSRCSDIFSSEISLGGLNHFVSNNKINNVLNIVRQVSRVRGFGDTYAYHLLTTGRCEAVIEENISIWDIAAISVIIEEAGGRITEFNGNKINYQTKSVIASNKILHESYINLFNHNNLKSC